MIENIKKHKNLVPLIVLECISISMLFFMFFDENEMNGVIYKYKITFNHWLSFALLQLNFIIYFYARKYFKSLIIITVLLGFLGLLKLFPTSILITFIIPSEPIFTTIGVIYFFLNRTSIMPKNAENNEAILDENRIEKLIIKYENRENDELIMIIEDKGYSSEAKLAATKLIENRKN